MKRWLRRIIYPLFIVIFVALAAIQIVIWSDWPRRVVLSLVQQQLGLRVEAAGLSTSWMGTTTLRDVKLSLPLSGESFLDMPTMTVRHTSILRLIITRNFDLQTIELNKPNLVVRRDSAGRWNLQDVAQLIARATAGTHDSATKSGPPKLPIFRLNDGSIVVIDEKTGQRINIAPVTASGDPQGALVWQYSLNVPKKLEITGLVAPGEDFKHEFKFSAVPGEWLTPWMAEPPAPLRINGSWTGSLVNKKTLTGRLELTDSQIANFGVKGRVGIQANDDDATFTPQNLTITTSIDTLPQVLIASGTLQLHGDTITAQQLRFGELGKLAQLDGSADLAGKTADVNGVWQELALPGHVTHSGRLHLAIKNSFPSHPVVVGDIATTGKTEQGSWEGNIHLDGAGRNWQEMDWTASVPHLGWSAKFPFEINELTARVSQRGQLISLTELKWPAADRITGRGEYNLRDQSWALRIRGGGTLQKMASSNDATPFDFNIDALGGFGDVKHVHLNDVFIHTRGIEAHAAGDYVSNIANEPVSLSLYVTHRPSDVAAKDELPIHGQFRSEGHVGGTLDPLMLKINGVVHSEDLVIRGHPYGDIHGNITGTVESDRETFVIGDMTMLGGSWKVSTLWPYDQKDKMAATEVLRIQVGVQHLSLPEVGDLLRIAGMKGQSNGDWTIDITKPKLNLISMRGSLDAKDISFRDVQADTMTAQMKLHNGTLQVDPIELHRAEKGVTIASFETTLDDLTAPTLDVKTTAWPIALSSGSAASTALWADAKLQLNTKTNSATGPIKARAMFATTQQAIGEATIEGNMNGRVVSLDSIKLTGIGGLASGRASIDTETPNRSTAALSWSGLEGQHIADLIPQLQGLEGKYDGALSLEPSNNSRAIEPLRLRIQLNPENAKYKAIAVGRAKLSAFMNFDSNFALQRIVLDELPEEDAIERRSEQDLAAKNIPITQRPLGWNDIRIADGRLKLWARRGRHPSGVEQTHIIADFERLDLNQIVHGFKSDADKMPGRLTGEVILHGESGNLDHVIGDGRMRITDSDLGEFDVLKVLYNAMSLGSQPKEPNGTGSLDLSLQQSMLTLNNIHYFNRGAEAWSSNLTIGDFWKIPNGPIEGYVVGSARPLSALKLPLLADVDQVLAVLQSNLTTVHVTGTVASPIVKTATFSDVSKGLKQFLTGQVNGTK